VWLGLALFVVSNVAFAFGENFAAAFLPEISTAENIGRISGLGWGRGYFGGLFSLLAITPFLAGDFVAANVDSLRVAWLVTAGFFALAGIPTFVLLRERAPRGPRRRVGEYARVGYARVGETFRSLTHFRDLARFLAVFFVFNSGLAAVITFSAIYARGTLAFTGGELITLFLVVQISSALGARPKRPS
jgi:UMF1 family MFS transporter